MDYERKYKDALQRARVWKEKSGMPKNKQGILDDIFPELKESEDKDEEIKKALITLIQSCDKGCYTTISPSRIKEYTAWLEKQGEQTNLPKFTFDDVLALQCCMETVKKVQEDKDLYEKLNDLHDRVHDAYHLEKQGEVESDNDDIEVEEKGIREAFNKIEDEKQCKQKPQRMISAEAKEAMYNKPADTVEPKCEESKTKIFDAPTPFEDKLYAFVAACEFLAIPSKIEFILEHSQEILDAAKEQIGKEQSSTWSEEDEKEYKYVLKFVDNILNNCGNKKDYEHCKRCYDWLKSLRPQSHWKPSDEQVEAIRLARSFVTDDFNEHPTLSEILMELEEQIKKLRED